MGTSSCYRGPGGGNPLIPSWLDSGTEPQGILPMQGIQPTTPGNNQSNIPLLPTPPAIPNIPQVPPNRFQTARKNYSQFAKSGGENHAALRRAVSSYVGKGAGGTVTATRRMGSARTAGARFYGFLASASANGFREALRTINLETLAGRPIDEVFIGICDYVCPDGGTLDEGITRHAFIETIAEVATIGVNSFDALTTQEMETVLEIFFTHSIEARMFNDIAVKGIVLPESIDALEQIQNQLHDFIKSGVSDAIVRNRVGTNTNIRALEFVDHVYEAAFSFLETFGAEGVRE